MAVIIDRRLNPKGKNHINRQKFLERAREQIKEAVKKSVTDNTIKQIGSGEKVKVRSKDVTEPSFKNDMKTGDKKGVLPGNKEYSEGDLVPKPYGDGSGRGNGKQPGQGDGFDEFEFTLTRDEFLNYLFEDLELPDFVKETMRVTDAMKYTKAGFTNTGSPANLNVLRTYKNSIGRRMAQHRPTDEEIAELERLIAIEDDLHEQHRLSMFREELVNRRKRVPFIDDHDLRYTFYDAKPQPSSQAVMFCLMDVSGSMGEREKDISKRFFLLLYLFLEKKYDRIDIKFIRHTEVAEEVDEQTFFYDRQSGGTAISSGLELISQIIKDKYSPQDWNIYVAQCTDGDNSPQDNLICEDLIVNRLQPIVQYYAYIQISDARPIHMFMGAGGDWSAMPTFQKLSDKFENMECRRITNQDQIWQVFRSLFQRKQTK